MKVVLRRRGRDGATYVWVKSMHAHSHACLHLHHRILPLHCYIDSYFLFPKTSILRILLNKSNQLYLLTISRYYEMRIKLIAVKMNCIHVFIKYLIAK